MSLVSDTRLLKITLDSFLRPNKLGYCASAASAIDFSTTQAEIKIRRFFSGLGTAADKKIGDPLLFRNFIGLIFGRWSTFPEKSFAILQK